MFHSVDASLVWKRNITLMRRLFVFFFVFFDVLCHMAFYLHPSIHFPYQRFCSTHGHSGAGAKRSSCLVVKGRPEKGKPKMGQKRANFQNEPRLSGMLTKGRHAFVKQNRVEVDRRWKATLRTTSLGSTTRTNKKLALKDETNLTPSSRRATAQAAKQEEKRPNEDAKQARLGAEQPCRDETRCPERILSPSHPARFIFPPVKFFMRWRWLRSVVMPEDGAPPQWSS